MRRTSRDAGCLGGFSEGRVRMIRLSIKGYLMLEEDEEEKNVKIPNSPKHPI